MSHETPQDVATGALSVKGPGPLRLFSVIVPAYNAAAVLPRALASVSRQTFDDYEVIVVDDGSIDQTLSVADSFQTALTLRSIKQENGGAAKARNTGAAAAHGRYLLFLDADDEAEPNWLQRLAEHVHGDPPVICCGLQRVEGSSPGNIRRPKNLGPAFYGYRATFLHLCDPTRGLRGRRRFHRWPPLW